MQRRGLAEAGDDALEGRRRSVTLLEVNALCIVCKREVTAMAETLRCCGAAGWTPVKASLR